MAPLRLVLALVAGLLLVAPAASAASADGSLTAPTFHLSEGARVASAGLDAANLGDALPTLRLTATEVALQRIGASKANAGGVVSHTDRAIDERASHATATLELVPGEANPIFALRSDGAARATLADATVRGASAALLGSATTVLDACVDGDERYCVDVFGAYEIEAADVLTELTGELTLLLYGPSLRVVADGEEKTWTSGLTQTQDAGPARLTEDVWLVVHAASASGTLSAETLRLYSTAPQISAARVAFENAEGSVRVGAMDHRASRDDVVVSGDIRITPGPVPRASLDARGGTVYAPAMTTGLSGDVRSIDLEGHIAFLDTPLERAGAAAILATTIALLIYGWQHVAFAAAALYTRLSKPDILDNDVRNHIYEIIRLTPGISAREVHRRSNQSWGTVVYHLRQLERHHLVVSRALGRTRNYYENHGKYRGMEIQLACLQSDRARALARAIVAQPGITQEGLAAASGLPQPTTSYYVRKLKQAALVVEERDGRYAKYVPSPDLPRFLEMSESAVQASGAAGTGVQA